MESRNSFAEPRVLLDMDEVLVDFVGGALKIHGWDRERLVEASQPPGRWPLPERMGLTIAEFWKPIHEVGEEFWTSLQPLPWHHELTYLLDGVTSDWHIVTAPSRDPSCYSGKVKWLKRYFGPTFNRFVITPHKRILACSNVILIDDREENVFDFIASGGWGITFPSDGNRLYSAAADPLSYLAEELRQLLPTL